MRDFYSHSDNKAFYVEESILGPVQQCETYNNLCINYNSQLRHSCNCIECNKSTCQCLQLSGGANYIQDTKEGTTNVILNTSKNIKKCPIIECNDLCKCLDNCGNRLVQKGPRDGLTVEICDNNKGLGLFTNQLIMQGSFICEYAGELITESQAISRHNTNKTNGRPNYIFCLNEYCNNTTTQTFVDPTYFGNIGRYINHSCEPNCEIIPVRVSSPIPKLAIFSLMDILSGSEITFDYGSNNLNNSTVNTIVDRKICLCKTPSCKMFMPFSTFS